MTTRSRDSNAASPRSKNHQSSDTYTYRLPASNFEIYIFQTSFHMLPVLNKPQRSMSMIICSIASLELRSVGTGSSTTTDRSAALFKQSIHSNYCTILPSLPFSLFSFLFSLFSSLYLASFASNPKSYYLEKSRPPVSITSKGI